VKSFSNLLLLVLCGVISVDLGASQLVIPSNKDISPMKLFFLGESCAGKTTLMHQLCILSDNFYMPKFTVTRVARLDDDPELFEYVSIEEYLTSRGNKEFVFDMDDGKTYYGYKNKHFSVCNKHALLYGSPFFIEQSSKLKNALLVLIESDKEKGFMARQDAQALKESRRQSNQLLTQEFFGQSDFRKKMDLIYHNKFGNAALSAAQLLEELYVKVPHQHPA